MLHDDLTFHDEVEAYCGRLSYPAGGVAQLHVSTRHPHVDVVVERWGAERETVWRSDSIDSTYTPPPGRDVAHACLVVTADRSANSTADAAGRARVLLVLATNTWNAYNPWGGRSLYTGGKQVSFRRPFARGMLCRSEVDRDDRKSRPTRWGEEPDVNGDRFQEYRTAHAYPAAVGSSGWFSHERRFVEWAEAAGYRFGTTDWVFGLAAPLRRRRTCCRRVRPRRPSGRRAGRRPSRR